GIFEFGRLWYANITVANAARMGAEYGALNPITAQDTAGIQNTVRAELSTLFHVDADNPAISVLRGSDPYGQPFVSVTVTYTFYRILPVPGFPGTVRITKTAIMRVQP
ncbi:MAG: pilus assembly protein, partial [Anaerolineae bacterium]|nr:pilus assembly protein [Anaerolineae bacterium]